MPKSARAYRDIGEAAAEVGVEAHVLRFWERELGFIKPLKRVGGRRFYRPGDVALLREVRRLRQEGRSLAEIRRLAAERRLAWATPRKAEVGPADPWTAAYQGLETARLRLDVLLREG